MKIIRNNFIFLTALAALVFPSCEKQTLEPSINETPKIFFEAKFNGFPVRFEAGKDNIIAESYITSSYDDSLITFNFTLKNYTNSYKYIHLSVNNYVFPYKSKENDIDSTVKPGKYLYAYSLSKPNNPKRLSEVILTCYSYYGSVYSSVYFDQQYSNFEILHVKDTVVQLNRQSYRVKKADIEFYCTLRNKFWGDTLNVSSGKMSVFFVRN